MVPADVIINQKSFPKNYASFHLKVPIRPEGDEMDNIRTELVHIL
jgi:hypothetical protein